MSTEFIRRAVTNLNLLHGEVGNTGRILYSSKTVVYTFLEQNKRAESTHTGYYHFWSTIGTKNIV